MAGVLSKEKKMNDTTLIEMVHLSGQKPKTQEMHIEAGKKLIEGNTLVKQLYVLKEGIVMVTPRVGVQRNLAQTEYVGIGTAWSILGARPFFSTAPSPLVYTALTDCTLFTFDSRMFQTEQSGMGLSKDALLGIARGLMLNSDISEIFVPKIAKALGYTVSAKPSFQEIQDSIKQITAEKHAGKVQELIFNCLVKLLKKHEEVSRGTANIVGSPALAAERRHSATPPPIPSSLARRAWEASRS